MSLPSPLLLRHITWEERWLEMEAEGEPSLPAYAGSTIRGALGAVMRPELCAQQGRCGEDCERPGECPFFSLFEQSRAGGGSGPNIPKPLILEPPLAGALHEIAMGGQVTEPYRVRLGRPLAVLENEWRMGIQQGGRLTFGLRALGVAGAALDGVVEGVRRKGLEVNGGRLRLVNVTGGMRRLESAEEEQAGASVKLVMKTPVMIRGANRGICCEPSELGTRLLDQAVLRTVALFNAFFAGRDGVERIPFVEPKWPGLMVTGHRLLEYRMERKSYRQDLWMDFEGVVGWMEWSGDVGRVLPWLRAAAVLHLGQKATFGFGQVEVMTRY